MAFMIFAAVAVSGGFYRKHPDVAFAREKANILGASRQKDVPIGHQGSQAMRKLTGCIA